MTLNLEQVIARAKRHLLNCMPPIPLSFLHIFGALCVIVSMCTMQLRLLSLILAIAAMLFGITAIAVSMQKHRKLQREMRDWTQQQEAMWEAVIRSYKQEESGDKDIHIQ